MRASVFAWARLVVALPVLVLASLPAAAQQQFTFTRFAGSPGGAGVDDGIGAEARFGKPSGVTADAAGNLYVSDEEYDTVRKVSPSWSVTTLAGRAGHVGDLEGRGAWGRFTNPHGTAVDSVGNVYVAQDCQIRKITSQGVVSAFVGLDCEWPQDGQGLQARFWYIRDLAIDADDNLYVTESMFDVRKITPAGMVSTFSGIFHIEGYYDGPRESAKFTAPEGIAVDRSSGDVYVADGSRIRKISGDTVTTLVTIPGVSLGALAIDSTDTLYVADSVSILKVTQAAEVSLFAGGPDSAYRDGTGAEARFGSPEALFVGAGDNLYVADGLNHAVRMITPAGVVTTVVGAATAPGSVDDTGTDARFDMPTGLTFVPSQSSLYVADTGNHTIRRITLGGAVTTAAGAAGEPGFGDAVIGTDARFDSPYGVAADSGGNVYVADTNNNRIRKIAPSGEVTTFAGSGVYGFANGSPGAAQFRHPKGVAVDASSNVWVADTDNHAIRMIAPDGTVSTIAGDPSTSSRRDGPASEAWFQWPQGLAIDSTGDVYVVESGSSAIRKITGSVYLRTVSSLPWGAMNPRGIAVDGAGNLYVTDATHVVARIPSGGGFEILGGTGSYPGSSDGTGVDALFNLPTGVVVIGNVIYVADSANHNIRLGRAALPDVATIDTGEDLMPIGIQRQLGTSAENATAWTWKVIRRPTASTAALSSPSVRTPTITPDVEDLFAFRLVATATDTASISELEAFAACIAGFPTDLFKVRVNQPFSHQLELVSALAPFQFFFVSEDLPPGITMTQAGLLSGAATLGGEYVSTIQGIDAAGCQANGTITFVVNRPPAALAQTVTTTENTAIPIYLAGDDPDKDDLTFTVVTPPAHGTFEAGIYSPATDFRGTDTFTFTAFDGEFTSAPATVTIVVVRVLPPSLTYLHLAGSRGGAGDDDGPVDVARLRSPAGVTLDAAGNVYAIGESVVRKIVPGEDVSTLAGMPGLQDLVNGPGGAARFSQPLGGAFDAAGNLYVADTGNNVIRRITPLGAVSTWAGTGDVGSNDGPRQSARFRHPTAVAIDAAGNLYVADRGNNAIRKIDTSGTVSVFSPAPTPRGIAIDGVGNLFVTGGHAIGKITPLGQPSIVAGAIDVSGANDGPPLVARFDTPVGIAVLPDGKLLVADSGNHVIRIILPDGTGQYAGHTGAEGALDGHGTAARFSRPQSIALDASGNLYVADEGNHAIRRVSPQLDVTTVAGLLPKSGSSDGSGSAAGFRNPSGAAFDAAGNVYVADRGNHTIRKVTPDGVVSTIAGAALQSGSEDGPAADARFNDPMDVAVDASGNVYVADRGNSQIRKISTGGQVSTVPSGTPLAYPESVAVAPDGNLIVADTANDRVVKLAPDGTVLAFQVLAHPVAVALDPAGRVYVGLTDRIVRLDMATGPTFEYLDRLGGLTAIEVDSQENVYVADGFRILKVTANGEEGGTIAGNVNGNEEGADGYARFTDIRGLALDLEHSRLYVADGGANTLRVGVRTLADIAAVTPEEAEALVTRQLDTTPQTATAWEWRLVRKPASSSAALSSNAVRNPTYALEVPDIGRVRLRATSAGGASISEAWITATCTSRQVIPAVLPKAYPSTAYSQPISASNGWSPFTARVTAGALPAGLTLSDSGVLSGTPATGGTYSFSVEVSDVYGCSATREYTLLVNRPPVASGFRYSVTEDTPLAVVLGGSDPDGDVLTPEILIPPAHGVLTGTGANRMYVPNPDFNGTDSLFFSIADDAVTSTAAHVFDVRAVNDPPRANAIPDPAAIDEDAPQQTVSFGGVSPGPADESAQGLTVTASSSSPALIPSVAVENSGGGTFALRYTPAANGNGSALITVVLHDDGGVAYGGTDTTTRTFTVNVTPINDAPVLEPIGDRTVSHGQTLTFTAAATDADGDPLTFSSANLPDGATFSPAGEFSWTPASAQSGAFAGIVLSVSDGTATDAETITITVNGTGASSTTTLSPSVHPSLLGQAVTMTATITSATAGTPGGTVTFKDNGVTMATVPVSGGKALWPTSTLAEGTHPITAEYSGDATYDGSTSAVHAHVVNVSPFGAPAWLQATATTSSQVSVTWSAVSGAVAYEVYRSSQGSPLALVYSTPALLFGDSGLVANRTYCYRVRAIGASGASPQSALDAATTTVFTDASLSGQRVKAIHFDELRTAVNAMRAAADLAPFAFDPAPSAGAPVRASQLLALRTALDQARAALGLPGVSYAHAVAAGAAIRAANLTEIRSGVQ